MIFVMMEKFIYLCAIQSYIITTFYEEHLMKTLLNRLVFAFLGIIFVSCSDTAHYRIGVSQCSDDDWRQKMNAEIERELMFHPEVEVEIRSADDSSDKQIADIRYFMENHFDAIVVAPNEAEALTPVISEAYESGIPVVVFDRNINNDNYTAWQGADNEAIGRSAGQHAVMAAGPSVRAIEIRGLKGSTPAEGRHDGFNSVSGVNVIAEGFGNWNYDEAAVVADSLFGLYPDVQVVYAHNDRMAIAAADVARRRGITPYIIGIDGAPEIGMKAVKDSVINATFVYPTEGQRLMQTALAIVNGEPYEKILLLPGSGAIEASNVNVLLMQNEEVKQETARMVMLKTQLDEYWAQHTSQTTFLYAVVIIVLLLSGLLFMVLRTFWQHRRHQAELDAATASKLAFFTNVSHDLRTPLTLIAEPVEQLAAADNITDRQRTLMKIADKNVRILKRLINQILDFRKYEDGKLVLNLSKVDFGTLVKEWGSAFEGVAAKRNIDYKVEVGENAGNVTALDVEKMESVFYNLVSNAFKYTPDGGSIAVDLKDDGNCLTLKVSDTGRGISADDLPLIFDRFFQADRVRPNGSGIGLALAKAFIELHDGTISVVSELGKGTVFTVKVPVRTSDDLYQTPVERMITARDVEAENDIVPERCDENAGPSDRPQVLVIDDNRDIRAMLSELLSGDYRVRTAPGGVEGLEIASRDVPDLIVCDVMMPDMDGLECCRRLKSDISTSHIPVLMLTACAMDEQRVEGYDVGADGYVSKPFSSAVLQARIRNLIANRRLIRDLWQGTSETPSTAIGQKPENTSEKSAAQGAPDIDSEFYRKFIELVNQQISNPDLNVEELASSMGLGRSQFYRKIKSLTNYSPVELLRRLRLARAQEMLTSTEQTVSEISYAVGFSTPAYFTKCYREAYGETPTEYRDKYKSKL